MSRTLSIVISVFAAVMFGVLAYLLVTGALHWKSGLGALALFVVMGLAVALVDRRSRRSTDA